MTLNKFSINLAMFLCVGVFAWAGEIDISGSWLPKAHEDALERGPGSNPGDFGGIPFNDAGRAKALSYSPSEISMPERECEFYTNWHIMVGPWGLKIWNETDHLTGQTLAWVIGGWETRAPMTIWMDGRPHPSKNAPHTPSGFTTGTWDGQMLTTYTTHMRTGQLRRSGAAISDQASMTMHFIRHGDVMTVAAYIDDPVYLTEPYWLSKSYVLSPGFIVPDSPLCIGVDEGVKAGAVPHLLPGVKNPLVEEFTQRYSIPQEAAFGGAETMYPAFRDKIKDKFVMPAKCTINCGAPRRQN